MASHGTAAEEGILKKQSTKQLSCVHAIKPTRRAFFHFVSEESLLEIISLCPKKPLNQIGGQLHLVHIQQKRISDTQGDFSAAVTPVTVSVRPKAKQKLVVPVVEWETSKESTSVTESGSETEPSEPQFSLCSELGAAAFLTSH